MKTSLSTNCKLIHQVEAAPYCLLSDATILDAWWTGMITCCLVGCPWPPCVLCPCSSRRQHWCGINLPSRTPCCTPNVRKKTFFSHKHIVCPIVYHCLLFLLTLFFPFLSQLLTLYLHYLSESLVLHYTGKSIERLNDPTNRDFCDLPFLEVVSFCSSHSFRSSWDEVLVCVCGEFVQFAQVPVLGSRLLAQSLCSGHLRNARRARGQRSSTVRSFLGSLVHMFPKLKPYHSPGKTTPCHLSSAPTSSNHVTGCSASFGRKKWVKVTITTELLSLVKSSQ